MKHNPIPTLLAIFSLLPGCTTDPSAEPTPVPNNAPLPAASHTVSEEQALEELRAVLEVIDTPSEGTDKTRSRTIRSVKNIARISDGMPAATRSSAASGVEDLLYIVNFEDDAGYAILGADDRLAPVYAITDEGHLTSEEWLYAVSATPEEAEADGELVFPLQMVAQAAAAGVGGPISGIGGIGSDGPGGWITPPPSGLLRIERSEDRRVGFYLPPQIPVTLHQGYPCNALCPVKSGKHCLAGCTAIALTQILLANYHKHESIIESIKGTPIDWSKIEKTFTNKKLLESDKLEKKPLTPEAQEVAKLVREVGRLLKIDYGLSSSGAWNQRLEDVLEQLHYQGVHDWAYQFSKVSQMLLERKMTTVVSGKNTVGTKKRHAFNLDGWLEREWTDTYYYINGHTSEVINKDQLIHCNFGWGGKCNGYYHYGAFDLRNGAAKLPDNIKEKDDSNVTDNIYYDMTLIVTYTRHP